MSAAPPHLLTLGDLDPAAFEAILTQAQVVKRDPERFKRALYEKSLLMIFQAPSLRTRLSFEVAMTQLHGHAINYYTVHSPWGVGKESVEDMARTMSRYCDAITARLYSHPDLENLAAWATVPVINAMTERGHPCQILGDYLTLREQPDRPSHIAYCGDARNNVTYSLMRAAALTGSRLTIACPTDAEFAPDPEVEKEVAAMIEAHGTGGEVRIFEDPVEAVQGAEALYTDSWMSYRVAPEEKERRHRMLTPYRVTQSLLSRAAENCIFLHCLPASRDAEVDAEVIDGPHSRVFDQAENRLHVQKAVLLRLVAG